MSGITLDHAGSTPSTRRPRVLRKLEKAIEELRRVQRWLVRLGRSARDHRFGNAFPPRRLDVGSAGGGPRSGITVHGDSGGLGLLPVAPSRPGQTQVAAELEDEFPELGQRVRTVVEYAAPAAAAVPASPGLLKALARDTDRRTAQLDFQRLVPWAAFERRAVGGLLRGDDRRCDAARKPRVSHRRFCVFS